nr:MAG TPA: hypothetical protein [Caudoviricetes sp.]
MRLTIRIRVCIPFSINRVYAQFRGFSTYQKYKLINVL